jgi:hypothetical protein
MASKEIMNELLLIFCRNVPDFPLEVTQLNYLDDPTWLLFENYVQEHKRLVWFTPYHVMEAVDSLLLSYSKLEKVPAADAKYVDVDLDLPTDLIEEIEAIAKEENKTFDQVINDALRHMISQEK